MLLYIQHIIDDQYAFIIYLIWRIGFYQISYVNGFFFSPFIKTLVAVVWYTFLMYLALNLVVFLATFKGLEMHGDDDTKKKQTRQDRYNYESFISCISYC